MNMIWLIEEGAYYNNTPYDTVVCRTKKIAIAKCRKDGFSYSAAEDLWSKDATKEWRQIVQTAFYK